MEHQPLLQRYRRDRRKLLEFLLSSSGLVTELRTPTGSAASLSHIDFDTLSADYVLDCVKSGGVVDISEATKKYFHESSYPLMIHSQLGNSFFLLSDPESSGSPPRRVPSPINVNRTSENASSSYTQMDSLNVEDIAKAGDYYGFKDRAMPSAPPKPVEDVKNMSLGLPHLNTEFLKDCWMMTCGSWPMKYYLHLWQLLGL